MGYLHFEMHYFHFEKHYFAAKIHYLHFKKHRLEKLLKVKYVKVLAVGSLLRLLPAE